MIVEVLRGEEGREGREGRGCGREVGTTQNGKSYSGEDTLPRYRVGFLLYIPGILTSYPSANIIETQHVVDKGQTNTKEPPDRKKNLNHTQLG